MIAAQMAAAQATADPPLVSLSFANNFWGKEDAGVAPLLGRMANAKTTCDELKAFYNARAAIEDEYGRKLLALARKPLGSVELGTLRASLDVVRTEVESMGKAHQGVALKMRSDLEDPLGQFGGSMKERRKIVQTGIEKLLKTKTHQTVVVNKARDRYEQECLKIKGYLAQGHMVMGQEERKNKAKLEKTQIQLSTTSSEYEGAVKVLEETTVRWNREWKAGCDKFQDLDEERIDFMKSSLWAFANLVSTLCVSDDQSCENMRLSLEECDVEKDISTFISDTGTGQEIPGPPKFIDFCRGDVNDGASVHSGTDDYMGSTNGYSYAQFQRSANPAFQSQSAGQGLLPSSGPPAAAVQPQHRAKQIPFQQNRRPPSIMQAPRPGSDDPAEDGLHHESSSPGGPNGYQGHQSQPPHQQHQSQHPNQQHQPQHQPQHPNQQHQPHQQHPPHQQAPPTQQQPNPRYSVAEQAQQSHPAQKSRSSFFTSPFRRRKDEAASSAATLGNGSIALAQHSNGSQSTLAGQSSRQPMPHDPDSIANTSKTQMAIGDSVFDVDAGGPNRPRQQNNDPGFDPIAAALAELTASMTGGTGQGREQAGHPSGHPSGPGPGALGVPEPAFTSRQMRMTKQRFVDQTGAVFGSAPTGSGMPNRVPVGSRPASAAGPSNQIRSGRSPSPGYGTGPPTSFPVQQQQQQQQQLQHGHLQHRSSIYSNTLGNLSQPSLNSSSAMAARPRAQSSSPVKQRHDYDARSWGSRSGHSPYPHGHQPGHSSHGHDSRGVSPSQQAQLYHQSRSGPYHRHTHTSSGGGGNGGPNPGSGSGIGRPHSRATAIHSGATSPADEMTVAIASSPRPRSHSHVSSSGGTGSINRPTYTQSGRAIIHHSRTMYAYRAAIDEELSFHKGDLLAVLRKQDDGWWEAEIVDSDPASMPAGGPVGQAGIGAVGLVPSNYLQTVSIY